MAANQVDGHNADSTRPHALSKDKTALHELSYTTKGSSSANGSNAFDTRTGACAWNSRSARPP
eukprot:3683444-Prorocentrum_lima.AAC.1